MQLIHSDIESLSHSTQSLDSLYVVPRVLMSQRLNDSMSQLLHHLRSPEVVEVDNALEFALAIHHYERSDLLLFHQRESGGGEFGGSYRARIAGHAFGGGQF